MGSSRVIAVKPGPAVTVKESPSFGKPRCVPAQRGDLELFPNAPSQTELCRRAGLPFQIGSKMYYEPTENGGTEMAGYDIETFESLEGGSLSDLSAAVDKYNLVQLAIGGGVGLATGLVLPLIMKKIKIAPKEGFNILELVKILAPVLLGGGGGFVLAKYNQPAAGAAVAAIGTFATGAMAYSRYLSEEGKSKKVIVVAFDEIEVMPAAQAVPSTSVPAAVKAGIGGPYEGDIPLFGGYDDDVPLLTGIVPFDDEGLRGGNVLVDEGALDGDGAEWGESDVGTFIGG